MKATNQKILDWYKNEIEKDKIELELSKKKVLDSLKHIEKDKIFEVEKKPSLWSKIKKILMGI